MYFIYMIVLHTISPENDDKKKVAKETLKMFANIDKL